jgi:hypothetical protein
MGSTGNQARWGDASSPEQCLKAIRYIQCRKFTDTHDSTGLGSVACGHHAMSCSVMFCSPSPVCPHPSLLFPAVISAAIFLLSHSSSVDHHLTTPFGSSASRCCPFILSETPPRPSYCSRRSHFPSLICLGRCRSRLGLLRTGFTVILISRSSCACISRGVAGTALMRKWQRQDTRATLLCVSLINQDLCQGASGLISQACPCRRRTLTPPPLLLSSSMD